MRTVDDRAALLSFIRWDVPGLRSLQDDGWVAVLRTFSLAFRPPDEETDHVARRRSVADRISDGLRWELSGNPDRARAEYGALAKRDGLVGMVGHLLMAWLPTSSDVELERASEVALRSRSLSREDKGLVHAKLASWSLDKGLRSLGGKFYEDALMLAGENLRNALLPFGDWFDKASYITFGGRSADPLIEYRWITDIRAAAAEKEIDNTVAQAMRSPWTMSWSFGGSASGGMIDSAELQASWAGALWLLPEIRRTNAALLLSRGPDRGSSTRAVALWALGDGKTPGRLAEIEEPRLGKNSADYLIEQELHLGRSMRRRASFIEICIALWDEFSDQLVDELIADLRLDQVPDGPSGDLADEFRLFGALSVRRPASWVVRMSQLSDESKAICLRTMAPGAVARLGASEISSLISADGAMRDVLPTAWSAEGWRTLVEALARNEQDQSLDVLVSRIPGSEITQLLPEFADRIDTGRIQDAMRMLVATLEDDLEQATRGVIRGRGGDPAVEIARCILALRDADARAVTALVRVASSRLLMPDQRLSALRGLQAIAGEDLVEVAEVEGAFAPVVSHDLAWGLDNAQAVERLESVMRFGLRSNYEAGPEAFPLLLWRSRDPDVRVRLEALRIAKRIRSRGRPDGPSDMTPIFFGALYDPDPSVQSVGATALLDGSVTDESFKAVGLARLQEVWTNSPRQVRIAAASGIRNAGAFAGDLRQLAEHDRSWLVRDALLG